MTDSGPPLATLALALTIEEWSSLGISTVDPQVAPTNDLDILVERVSALLLVRCVAVVAPLGTYPDLSTSNICRHALVNTATQWPAPITDTVIAQLKEYAKRILAGYKDVPYHNREHAVHVVLSMNKLLDLVLSQSSTGAKKKRPPVSFGFRNDAMAVLACLFAALIHDVEHQGIPNRQLAVEDDRLAVLYNDQSIAENWSVYIAFSELLQDDFKDLREAIFPDKCEYRRFRKMVINLVLTTDIASPERTQLVKSKWKEAFGDPIETIERKMQAEARRMSLTGQNVQFREQPARMDRRGTGDTGISEVSFDAAASPRLRDDESPSITPEGSAHDDEEGHHGNNLMLPPELAPNNHQQRMFQRRRSSAASRRSSTSRNTATSKYRQRLGILRTVDLSGETLENYSRHGSMGGASHMQSQTSEKTSFTVDLEEDEPDDLRMTVVMETLMQASDVAHNLQGWEHMVKFSNRLYLELRKSYADKRGGDPEPKWFENQIGFLESYLLPLAHRLEDTGVFGATEMFGMSVESLRDRWLTDGYDVTQSTIAEGAKAFPVDK